MGLSFNRLNYTIQDVFGESSYAEKMKKKCEVADGAV